MRIRVFLSPGIAAVVCGLLGCAGSQHRGPEWDACHAVRKAVQAERAAVSPITESTFEEWYQREQKTGCRFLLEGSVNDYPVAQFPDDLLRSGELLPDWEQPFELNADGPDGNSFVIRTAEASCLVNARWDGGDPTDPNYVPDDFYELEIWCSSR